MNPYSIPSLVAGVAYEINTPPGSINSNTDILRRSIGKLKSELIKIDPDCAVKHPNLENMLKMVAELSDVNKRKRVYDRASGRGHL